MNKEIYNALLAALKAKFEGVSDAVLDRVIKNKFGKTVTTTEQVETAVAGVTWQSIIDSYGDSRATEAQVTAVSNYEKKHGLKDGVKIEDGGSSITSEQQPADEDMPAWAKKLIDSNQALTERVIAVESGRVSADRRQKLSEVTAKLPESLRKAYERTPVENITDEEFSTLIGDVTNEVAGIIKDTTAKGAVFGKPSVVTGRQAQQNDLTKEQLEAINARSTQSSEGQPF
ncbi:MAG: hypothetical protein MJY71_02475 [Bacteroidaceae bacterium]|nr:hypothetical protein [Bacteroidaceae bacterium]